MAIILDNEHGQDSESLMTRFDVEADARNTLFITVSGTYASGKTTLSSQIAKLLDKLGATVIFNDPDMLLTELADRITKDKKLKKIIKNKTIIITQKNLNYIVKGNK